MDVQRPNLVIVFVVFVVIIVVVFVVIIVELAVIEVDRCFATIVADL